MDGTDETATGSRAVITTTTTTTGGLVSSSSRKAIIEAASRVGEASNDLLRHVMNEGADDILESTTHLQLLTEEERQYQVGFYLNNPTLIFYPTVSIRINFSKFPKKQFFSSLQVRSSNGDQVSNRSFIRR